MTACLPKPLVLVPLLAGLLSASRPSPVAIRERSVDRARR